jgi:hypothetical protein
MGWNNRSGCREVVKVKHEGVVVHTWRAEVLRKYKALITLEM